MRCLNSRTQIVAEARAWIGTPYVHQACRRGAGTDCLGLVRGVWQALFQDEPRQVPPYTKDWGEHDRTEILWDAARRFLVPVPLDSAPQPGQVLLFRMQARAIAKHLGIVAAVHPHITFVHAYSGRSVAENTLSLPWARRVVARFEFPAIGDV